MSAASIRALPNGPYLVSGEFALTWKQPAMTERGEPIAWRTGPELDHSTPAALCRCGGSANKPFCDGTHARQGFAATDPADGVERAERVRDYPGEGLIVHDDRSICTHAGFCGTATSNVWKMVAGTDDTSVRAQVIGMIERCPSGALSYSIAAQDEDIEPDLATRVAVTPDGPLWVTGGVPVEKSDGTLLERRNRVTLCRCGQSENKPLCDGSHKEAGFQSRPEQTQPAQ
jgi:CDGSH-type Zn-finger protein